MRPFRVKVLNIKSLQDVLLLGKANIAGFSSTSSQRENRTFVALDGSALPKSHFSITSPRLLLVSNLQKLERHTISPFLMNCPRLHSIPYRQAVTFLSSIGEEIACFSFQRPTSPTRRLNAFQATGLSIPPSIYFPLPFLCNQQPIDDFVRDWQPERGLEKCWLAIKEV